MMKRNNFFRYEYFNINNENKFNSNRPIFVMTNLNLNNTMKKFTALLFLMAFASSSFLFGQDSKKMMKEAEKLIKSYTKDLTTSDVDLSAVMSKLDAAFEDASYASEPKNHIKKGDLISKIIDAESVQYGLNPDYKFKAAGSAISAFKAYAKANELGETKKSIKGVSDLEGSLNNAAAFYYNQKDYANAFTNFQYTLKAKDLLSGAGKPSRLDADSTYSDQVLFTGVSAYYSEDQDAGLPYFEQLRTMGKTDPIIFEALYTITNKTNPSKAVEYLAEGREKNPKDTGILFTEINHYLKSGELTKLITKLESAIEAEPENVSVYTTLGSVYDQLAQEETKANNTAKATEYFDKAKSNFAIATTKDESNFDAIYSLGALYYNKAAGMVDALNELAADFSSDGMKKYDAKKMEMDNLFKEALPYFQKAETVNSKDMNTLIALKEIYARLNQVDKSEAYKAKIEGM